MTPIHWDNNPTAEDLKDQPKPFTHILRGLDNKFLTVLGCHEITADQDFGYKFWYRVKAYGHTAISGSGKSVTEVQHHIVAALLRLEIIADEHIDPILAPLTMPQNLQPPQE